MGKSDSFVFPFYTQSIKPYVSQAKSVAFLGFSKPNSFTDSFSIKKKEFFDYQLGNWDINASWILQDRFDLIVCTRCAYFSKDPEQFIRTALKYLSPTGALLVDWGLGDHWRFEKFKIGWIRDGEHEYAQYDKKHHIQSIYWRPEFDDNPTVLRFFDACAKFGYDTSIKISNFVEKEVPYICSTKFDELVFYDFLFLWPHMPQLTLLTIFKAPAG